MMVLAKTPLHEAYNKMKRVGNKKTILVLRFDI